MTQTNPNPDALLFDALLVPHRSLGRTGFAILMATMVLAFLFVGIVSIAHNQWPVAGFFGLDVIGLYVAFRLSYRSARAREEVRLSRACLDIRQIAPSGRAREMRFNPFFARFRVDRDPAIGVTAMAVTGQGQHVGIGSFLNPPDRESFSSAFAVALAEARR